MGVEGLELIWTVALETLPNGFQSCACMQKLAVVFHDVQVIGIIAQIFHWLGSGKGTIDTQPSRPTGCHDQVVNIYDYYNCKYMVQSELVRSQARVLMRL